MACKSVRRKRRIKEALYQRQRGRCHYCGDPMLYRIPDTWKSKHHPPSLATIDHVKARGLGGTNAQKNLVMACHKCNARKSGEESKIAAARRAQKPRPAPLATLCDVWV